MHLQNIILRGKVLIRHKNNQNAGCRYSYTVTKYENFAGERKG